MGDPSRLLGGLALTGAACFAYGVLAENQAFRLRRVTVPVLPPGSPRLRVLHISDAHLLVRNRARARFVAGLAGLEPDLVVNTGDNVAEASAIDTLAKALGRLLERPGVYVMGSNDYTGPRFSNPLGYLVRPTSRSEHGDAHPLPTSRLKSALSSGGWIDLTQAKTLLEVGGITLELRGTDDAHLGLDDYAAVAGKPNRTADLAIGVTHAPYRRVLDAMTADKVKMIFAGHTHGGQVCVPLYGALTTNCDLPLRQAKGLSKWKAGGRTSWLHVSAGLGSSPMAPYRFACPPEATLVSLTPRPTK
ncbi:MAG: metallophosphoesterase [Propionibacteriaceae bacterium]|nr:metallophosphoesterase [Propionibacteriaceae bacterium]